jgi:RHS repeat-associated protein
MSSGSYRYGFNGKELDNEPSGTGNQYDYGFRIYNPRLGRFFSVDPLMQSYPYFSPYQFSGNMPIAAIDIDGLEQYVIIHHKDNTGKTNLITITTARDNEGNLLDQNITRAVANKDGTVENVGPRIAKGNVLVFELYNEGTRHEQLKIIRNTSDPKKDKLAPQELKIYKEKSTLMAEKGDEESLVYPYNKNQYASKPLENALTKTFLAEQQLSTKIQRIVVPPQLQGNLNSLFGVGVQKTIGNGLPNGSLINGGQPELSMYSQLLGNIKRAGGAQSINISLNFRMPKGLAGTEQREFQNGLSIVRQRLLADFQNAGVKNVNVSVTSDPNRPQGSVLNITQ